MGCWQEVTENERRWGLRKNWLGRGWRRKSCCRWRWWWWLTSGCCSWRWRWGLGRRCWWKSCCCGCLNKDTSCSRWLGVKVFGASFFVSRELRKVVESRKGLARLLTLRPWPFFETRATFVAQVLAVIINDFFSRRRCRESGSCTGRMLRLWG